MTDDRTNDYLYIDDADLHGELVAIAKAVADAGVVAAVAGRSAAMLGAARKRAYADALDDALAADSARKVTVKEAEGAALRAPAFVAAERAECDALYHRDVAQARFIAARAKKDALVALAANVRAELTS